MLLTGFLSRYDVFIYAGHAKQVPSLFFTCAFHTFHVYLKSSEVKYLTLQDLDEVLEIFIKQEEEEGEEIFENRTEEELESPLGKCLILKWSE